MTLSLIHILVRGNEYLSSSPKYNRLYEAFGWEVPVYVHCPTITNEEHKKLSKRSGHSSFEDLLEQGFLTEAIVNFVALLGWSPAGNQEFFTLEAVSYTHLDVYKRQPSGRWRRPKPWRSRSGRSWNGKGSPWAMWTWAL